MISNVNFLEEMSNFKIAQTYARHRDGGRESWKELVGRSKKMHLDKFKNSLEEEDLKTIEWCFDEMVGEQFVCPSMRSLQFAGEAIKQHNASMFNCTVSHIDSLRRMAEGFYLLLCGCGVTFGLNKKHLSKLPSLIEGDHDSEAEVFKYRVEDTIQGWADSLEVLLLTYFKNTPFSGRSVIFDYSGVRRKGTILKTRGGKAPGPSGLKKAHNKIKKILDEAVKNNQDRIKTIQIYDILMHSADAVLSGGVRRAATAIIFDLDDEEMIKAKGVFDVSKIISNFTSDDNTKAHVKLICNGKRYNVDFSLDVPFDKFNYDQLISDKKISWSKIEPQRGRSNNSVRLIRGQFDYEKFKSIFETTRFFGEPAFVFCNDEDTLLNPCFEVSFIPVTKDGRLGFQMCNLTTQNGAKITSKEIWKKCVKAATIIGTLQASYTDFIYLSEESRELTEEEALLGVSLTGWMDNPDVLLDPKLQREMAQYAVEVNKEWAKKIGINQAARVTLVKPEGTSSIVLRSASGCHAQHARRFFRRMQINKEDNVYKYFKKHNPHVCEESVWSANKTDDVIKFPVEIPEGALVKKDLSAKKHLEIIKGIQKNWIDTGTTEANKKPLTHNCSCFSGDTKFITNYGLKTFKEIFSNNDLNNNLKVVDRNGNFVGAKVNHYGKQRIYNLTLQSGRNEIKFQTTKDHIWPITSGQMRYNGQEKNVETINLKPSMQIHSAFGSGYDTHNLEALLHGIVFGDGSYHVNNKKCQIYLCGDSRHLSRFFIDYDNSLSIIERDDLNQTRIYGLPSHWKKFPETIDGNYIYSFIAGWFAADGHVTPSGRDYTLASAYEENLAWLQNTAPIGNLACSIKILKHKRGAGSYKTKHSHFYTLSFKKESLNNNFFVHEKKRQRYEKSSKKQSCKHYKVVSIEETDNFEDVYCVEQPDTHEFVLEGNVLTHNCTVILDEGDWEWVPQYLFDNQDSFSAVSLISKTGDKDYQQAPMEEIVSKEDEDEWDRVVADWTSVNYDLFTENSDGTTKSDTVACAGGACEIL